MRKRALGVPLVLAALAIVPAADAGHFTKRGTVASVVDGDTIRVRLAGGGTERVRVLGIDTPELRGRQCFAVAASRLTSSLTLRHRVVLTGDRSQPTRDRYGRLLAYVSVGGRDLGLELVRRGAATTYTVGAPFSRVAAYRRAEAAARAGGTGRWGGCRSAGGASPPATPAGPNEGGCVLLYPSVCPSGPPDPGAGGGTTPPATPPGSSAEGCDASYPGVCIPPPPPDLDCDDIAYRGFVVRAPDPHRFDGDHDGVGCES